MNVLVIAPHPDDEAIGCGGAICLHSHRGDRVAGIYLTSGERGLRGLPEQEAQRVREEEAENAAATLGIISLTFLRYPDGHLDEHIEIAATAIAEILARESPKLIYLPDEHDWHPDHRSAVAVVRAAMKNQRLPRTELRSYEVLTPLREYDYSEDITAVLPRKLAAIQAHRSQNGQIAYDRAARALAEYRGVTAQTGGHAEVFRVSGEISGVDPVRRADPNWHRVFALYRELERLVPEQDAFILVDESQSNLAPLLTPRKCIPFLEKDGRYWGRPSDDATAIREIERLRKTGAVSIAFAANAFWWFEHYKTMSRYLRDQFPCVVDNKQLIFFDLQKGSSS